MKVYLVNSFDWFIEAVRRREWTVIEAGRTLSERLERIESTDLVLANLDALNAFAGFDLGCAIAWGKTVIGMAHGSKDQLPELWRAVSYVVEDTKDLEGVLGAFDHHEPGCPDQWHRRQPEPGGFADSRPCPTCDACWR